MKIVLKTSGCAVSNHYIETLVLLYMPCEKFGKDETYPLLDIEISRDGEKFYGTAVLDAESKVSKEVFESSVYFYPEAADKAKCFAGQLFINLFSKRFGFVPPWGMMTGVRPAGYAMELMKSGMTQEEVKNVFCECYGVGRDKAALATDLGKLALDLRQAPERDYSLYAGIPFCPSRCRYCSFVSYATPNLHALLPQYMQKLTQEVKMLAKTAKDLSLNLKSVYIGGGTPSMPDADALRAFLYELRSCLDGEYELDFEGGRPDTLNDEKLDILKEYGVTRLCINTQTTNDEILKAVGRNHTFADYKRAFFAARDKGFVINTDLIAGLPGESYESFKKSVDDIVALEPENITVHAFSLKKSSEYTVSGKRFSVYGSDAEKMILYSSQALSKSGYIPYYMYRQKNTEGNLENVGYTKNTDVMCRYNIYMMEGLHSVFAAGAGASTKLVGKNSSDSVKIYNPKYPYEYLSGFDDILNKEQRIKRFYNDI